MSAPQRKSLTADSSDAYVWLLSSRTPVQKRALWESCHSATSINILQRETTSIFTVESQFNNIKLQPWSKTDLSSTWLLCSRTMAKLPLCENQWWVFHNRSLLETSSAAALAQCPGETLLSWKLFSLFWGKYSILCICTLPVLQNTCSLNALLVFWARQANHTLSFRQIMTCWKQWDILF